MAENHTANDDKMYDVVLAKSVRWSGTVVRPGTNPRVKGSVLKGWPDDAVSSFTEAEEIQADVEPAAPSTAEVGPDVPTRVVED